MVHGHKKWCSKPMFWYKTHANECYEAFALGGKGVILYIKANMVSVCPSVCGDKNKTRSWNERGLQNFRGPEPRWPKSSIKDLNQDSQYPIQTSRRTWNEVLRKKTRRWGPETRSSERKPIVRVLKRGCTPTGNFRFRTYWRRTDSRTQVRFSVGWCFWVFKEPSVQVL